MDDLVHGEPAAGDRTEDRPAGPPAPVIPDELVKGEWHRRLVLPNQDGQLRLTPVRTARGSPPPSPSQTRFLDDKRRHSA